MGSWGIKAHESDSGLDYLGLFKKENLEKVGYKHFDIKAARIFLHNHIIGVITKENKGCSKKDMDFYIDANFPYEYGVATMLIAECLVEYIDTGACTVSVYNEKTDKLRRKKIKSFVYTVDDLSDLVSELQNILDPKHDLYQSWDGFESFDEWKSHVETLHTKIERMVADEKEKNELVLP